MIQPHGKGLEQKRSVGVRVERRGDDKHCQWFVWFQRARVVRVCFDFQFYETVLKASVLVWVV